MKIWTCYFANLANLPDYIVPVSIAGWPPKGWKGLEYKKVAPKWWFFKVYKETGDQDYYVRNFQEHVLGQLTPEGVIEDLAKLTSGAQEIALVCYEKPGDFCHRHLVAQWLDPEIVEWTKEN